MPKQTRSSFQSIASEHAKLKKNDASQKAFSALEDMKAKGLIINFNSLANYSGVSKAWLYRNTEIKNKIIAIRENSSAKRMTDPTKIIKKKEAEIAKLKKKLTQLEQVNKNLTVQLEVLYAELYQKN